jgi:glycosyltransferase involved in cell wall biosynthesis
MISVSHAVVRAVARDEHYLARKMRVIWNGEDLEKFRPGDSPVRAELGLAADDLIVTCVGGLDPVKDHRTLIESFAVLAVRYPRAHLLLVGKGGELERLRALAAPLGGRVMFLGHRADVADILRASDIYAQTSRTEGFSNAILQAMATALPVVATRVGGNTEMLEQGRGLLVESGNAAQAAEALLHLAGDADLRRETGAAARAWALANGDLDAIAAAYMDAFERAVEGRFQDW